MNSFRLLCVVMLPVGAGMTGAVVAVLMKHYGGATLNCS